MMNFPRRTTDMVREWHKACHIPAPVTPTVPPPSDCVLALRLIEEEVREVKEALESGDLVQILHELTDLQYVLDGLYVRCGLDRLKEAAFSRIHHTNMTKVGPDGSVRMDSQGKILKPEGFTKADLSSLLTDTTRKA